MGDLQEIFRLYGKERALPRGEVLCCQGAPSDGVYYLTEGWLGVYREEQGNLYLLSEVAPGSVVGELGSTTGWPRTATVRAEEPSRVIHISEQDFKRAMDESPALAAEVFCQVGERLTEADAMRVTLGQSYRQAVGRVETLRSEKAQLEELFRLREELASMIVHDLRNPLGVVSSGVQLLAHVSVAETELEYVNSVVRTMSRSVARMERLVETLLDISRLEEGAMSLRLLPLDIAVLIKEMMEEERQIASERGVELANDAPADLPRVLGDRDVIQRVLVNLVDNALKFTPKGGRVWLEAETGDGEVRVVVGDTGPGIPPEERARIFEKFTQLQGVVSSRRGAGLGLTFCRMAVEAHGGRIWIEDGPDGAGSRFIFALPRA